MTDKIFYSIDCAVDVRDFIRSTDDINFIGDTKKIIIDAPRSDLMRIGKSIGSSITIHSADIVDVDFLAKVMKK